MAGGVVYTKHSIPFTPNFYAYCPRVNPADVNFAELTISLKQNNCININFDVPNIIVGSDQEKSAVDLLKKYCVKAPRDQFAKGNMIMDLTKSEDELFKNMHTKHRYNAGLALRKGLTVKVAQNDADFDTFFSIYDSTTKRQHYYGRSKTYLKKLWDLFKQQNAVDILTCFSPEGEAVASWMLFYHEYVAYYPYGGSLTENKSMHGSCLLGWEAIKLAKSKGNVLFDMWGAAVDPTDEKDSYYGFTVFKQKFGATHVKYIDSYDLVVNETIYKMFNTANNLRWKALNFLR